MVHIISVLEVNSLEVVVLALVSIGQVPKNTDILQGNIVPLISVRIVWCLIVMQVGALPPAALDLDEFSGVQLLWPASLVLQSSWNPASVHNDSCSLNQDRILLANKLLKEILPPS